MANQVSPGIEIREIDNFLTVPAQTNNLVAFAAPFTWGPVSTPIPINSANLRSVFGKPTDENYTPYMMLKGFLDYDSFALCTRIDTGNLNGVSSGSAVKIKNTDHYETLTLTQEFIAKYPGTLGNSIGVSVCTASSTAFNAWSFKNLFDSAPGTSDYALARGSSNDEMHIVVYDVNGKITGYAGTVLEKHAYLSQASDVKVDGQNKYYADWINQRDKYIWFGDHISTLTNAGQPSTDDIQYVTSNSAFNFTLTGGTDDYAPTTGETVAAYQLYADTEEYDIGIILGPEVTNDEAGSSLTQSIANICENRADVVGVLSVPVSLPRTITNPEDAEMTFLSSIDSSYVTFAHNAIYMEDTDNNKFRWVPTGGQIAGTMVYTDRVANEWSAPAGYNRGQIRSAIKLAYSPNLEQREKLYKARINPIIKTKNSGIILYGNKTALSRPSSTQSLNVRRLFNYIKKKYRTIAKFTVFELNNASTRISLVNTLDPDLSEIRSRGGVYDYQIVCDETNNPPNQIDAGNLICYVKIKATRVAERVRIDLISTPTGFQFDEIF